MQKEKGREMDDWLDRGLTVTEPSTHVTPKDVYAMMVSNQAMALCISCGVGRQVEILRNGTDDRVVRRSCQGCGARQGRLL